MLIGRVVWSVVGIVAGILALIGALWWAWKYKKRRGTAAVSRVQVVPANDNGGHLDIVTVKSQESGGNQIYEVPGISEERVYEVDNTEVGTRSQ
jgi:hypothetical protein